jgi:hypothetical protein
MTHSRDNRLHIFECDGCGDGFGQTGDDEEIAEFNETWRAAQDSGWVSFKLNGEWQHMCPECKGRVGD